MNEPTLRNFRSVSAFREDLTATLNALDDTGPIFLLRHNQFVGVVLSAADWRELHERIADLEDEGTVLAAKLDPEPGVRWEELKAEVDKGE